MTLRVVVVTGNSRQPDGSVNMVDLWLLTKMSPEQFSPDNVATRYRLRWEIEQLFRVLKTVGQLDQLHSSKPQVFLSFLYATLLGVVLAHDVCAQMRRAKPQVEPSIHRVTALVLGVLPRILRSLGTPRLETVLASFEQALWREGVNPNQGRLYASTLYPRQIVARRAT